MMYQPSRTVVLVFLVGCALSAGAYYFLKGAPATADSTAQSIVEECAASGEDHSACYESLVPDLYPRLSVSEIFDLIRTIRQQDPSYQFCHVLGHKVGERVVAEDPNGWVDAISLNPFDGLCSNGFIHGVVGGRFRSEVLDDATIDKFLPDFIRACQARSDWQPSNLDRAICYHGMGHLFDFITNADIPKALTLCSRVAPEDYRRVCIQGVFMQIYQPLEPDDYVLIDQMPVKPTKENVRTFCAAYGTPIYVGSCLEESWPLFREEIMDGTGLRAFCSGQPDETETTECYISMSSIIGRMQLGKPEQVAAACMKLPQERQETCFSYSAQAVLEESLADSSKAVALCGMAPSTIAQECVAELISHTGFTFGQNRELHTAFCNNVPASLRASCMATL
jgi:hypothetical protein